MRNKFFQDYIEDNEEEVKDDSQNDTFDDSEWSSVDIEKASKENIVNKRNEEEFQNVMSNASRKLDVYWDKNNLFIRIITYFIWVFAILGALYYIILWFSSN